MIIPSDVGGRDVSKDGEPHLASACRRLGADLVPTWCSWPQGLGLQRGLPRLPPASNTVGVIAFDLAHRLHDAGLAWSPDNGDRFWLPDRDLEQTVFTVSDMVVEVRDQPAGRVLAFNGTTEWALDDVEEHEAVWLPRLDQLLDLLGDRFLSLTARSGGHVVRVAGGPAGGGARRRRSGRCRGTRRAEPAVDRQAAVTRAGRPRYLTSARRRDSSPTTRGRTTQIIVVEPSIAHSSPVLVAP